MRPAHANAAVVRRRRIGRVEHRHAVRNRHFARAEHPVLEADAVLLVAGLPRRNREVHVEHLPEGVARRIHVVERHGRGRIDQDTDDQLPSVVVRVEAHELGVEELGERVVKLPRAHDPLMGGIQIHDLKRRVELHGHGDTLNRLRGRGVVEDHHGLAARTAHRAAQTRRIGLGRRVAAGIEVDALHRRAAHEGHRPVVQVRRNAHAVLNQGVGQERMPENFVHEGKRVGVGPGRGAVRRRTRVREHRDLVADADGHGLPGVGRVEIHDHAQRPAVRIGPRDEELRRRSRGAHRDARQGQRRIVRDGQHVALDRLRAIHGDAHRNRVRVQGAGRGNDADVIALADDRHGAARQAEALARAETHAARHDNVGKRRVVQSVQERDRQDDRVARVEPQGRHVRPEVGLGDERRSRGNGLAAVRRLEVHDHAQRETLRENLGDHQLGGGGGARDAHIRRRDLRRVESHRQHKALDGLVGGHRDRHGHRRPFHRADRKALSLRAQTACQKQCSDAHACYELNLCHPLPPWLQEAQTLKPKTYNRHATRTSFNCVDPLNAPSVPPFLP